MAFSVNLDYFKVTQNQAKQSHSGFLFMRNLSLRGKYVQEMFDIRGKDME